jgi:hypothetical protein
MLESNEEKLLEETLKMEKENNKMLHTLYQSMIWGRVFRIFYWMLILASLIGSYYVAQPYIEKILNFYNQASELIPGMKP